MRYFDKAFFKLALGFIALVAAGLLLVAKVHAQVVNEVLYSPSAKQWVEIYNNTDSSIDLSQYKLLDAGAAVNGHGISPVITGGATLLPSHEYGVVAKDPTTVSASYVFKASLGVKTTGDTVVLKKGNSTLDSVVFSDGAAPDGSSLSRQSSGSFAGAAPTPGQLNALPSIPGSSGTDATSTNATSTDTGSSGNSGDSVTAPTYVSSHYSFVPVSNFSSGAVYQVSAGRARLGFIGMPLSFKAAANTSDLNAAYLWSFGDGTTAGGGEVKHAYNFAGDYVVVLNSSLLDNAAVSRVAVKIIEPEIAVTDANQTRITLNNKSKYEMNLYGWKLVSGGDQFGFPMDTIMTAGGTVSFPSSVTKLSPGAASEVVLLRNNEETPVRAATDVYKPDAVRQKSIDDISLKLSHAEKLLADMLSNNDEAPQTASVSSAVSASSTVKSANWVSTVKHFFGF